MKKLLAVLVLVAVLATSLSIAFAEEPVEITFWHQFTDNPVFDNIAEAFMAENPNIKINLVPIKTQDMNTTLKMALTSGTGPDIFYYDAGPGYMGALADAGLLLPLDSYAEQYGWREKLAGWALNACERKDQLWGIASEYEMLCVWYNREIFAQLGVEVPTTYDEFVAICEKAKEAGIIGLGLDDMDQWPGYHYESLFFGAFGGNELETRVLNQEEENGWNQPQFAEGLDALRALVEKGYTSDFPNGIAHDDALRDFYTGGSAMYLTGTWATEGMYENMGDNVDIFVFPAASADILTTPPVGVGCAMQVSATTAHPDEVIKFLDYIFDANGGAKIFMSGSYITPADVDTSDMTFNPLFLKVVEIADNTSEYNYNIDVLMPANVNDATANYVQQVIDGVVTGQQAVEIKQEEFAKAIEAGEY